MADMIEVSLWRGKADGRYQTFQVPQRENQTVLDVVTWVQRNADPTLSYRFACRVGMCGSCAMTVNGRPRWTCRTHISKVVEDGKLEIGPLANLPVIKDLAADMARVLREVAGGQGRVRAEQDARRSDREDLARQARRASLPMRPSSASTARCALRPAIRCAGTRTIWARRRSIAPGRSSTTCAMPAIASGLSAMAADGGCHACHSHQSCQEHCPNKLNPTASIAGLKRRTMQAYIKGEL